MAKVVTLNEDRMPDTYNIKMYRGDDVSFTITLSGADAEFVTPAGGATARSWVRLTPDGAKVEFDCTVIEPGVIHLQMSAEKTRAILGGFLFPWDFQVTNDEGFTRTYLRGQVIMQDDITV